MHFDEADTELIKKWVIQKLEDISDADSDVLADYVLALIKTDDPEPIAKANCVENLRDFLLDGTSKFVDDVFAAIANKSYDPSRTQPTPTASTFRASDHSQFDAPRQLNRSRKRQHHDREADEHEHGSGYAFASGERPIKQARRGGRGGFDRGARSSHASPRQNYTPSFPQHDQAGMLQMPVLPGMDPNNPFAAFLAMQQAMGLLPNMPGFPGAGGLDQNKSESGQRCRDYDTKGFCARGVSCPYEHGNDPFVIPQSQEYDPNNATLLGVQPNRTGYVRDSQERGRGGHRGRGRAHQHSRGGRRSELSHHGPNHDRSVQQIVIEQIPADRLDESSVREFFSEFGEIEEVSMQPDKRLAVVKYSNYNSAKAAYESPKVIFDNRFVKVYWHKSDAGHANGYGAAQRQRRDDYEVEMQDQEPEIDPEEVARKQEEAQRKHEEQQKLRQEADKQRQDLDSKIRAMEAQRKQMMARLAHKTGTSASPSDGASTAGPKAEDSEQTQGLREQLAKLEAEAKSLGIDPNAPANAQNGFPYRGRGGFRGRARGRGAYAGYRGRWAPGVARGGAVKRLDNRPKTVAVAFQDGTYETHQEALRQYLMFNTAAGDSASLDNHPIRKDTALITFPERYQGEMFMVAAGASDFPFAGKIDLSWHKLEDAFPTGESLPAIDANVGSGDTSAHHEEMDQGRDMEAYDVAEDDDRWG